MKKESVWNYPRPPRLEEFSKHIRVVHQGTVLVDSANNYRVLETSHPPTYYIPVKALKDGFFVENQYKTYCEFKGTASYLDLMIGDKVIKNIGWYYPEPNRQFLFIKNHASFYASKLDQCLVGDEKVQAQEGDFYGGWITSNIKGPFKGGVGTHGW